MSFLIGTNDQTVIFHSSTLPLSLFPPALGFPAQWHIMWSTMCLCHHSAAGKTQPVYCCLLTQVQPFHSLSLLFHSVLGPDCHNVRKRGKASLWPQHFSTPSQEQGGNPQRVVCLVLTSMNLRVLPKAFSLWKQRDLGWNLTQLFGECWGPPQVGNDVGAREEKDWTDIQEQGTDADVFCAIPECWIRFVFGTQLPGIMFAVGFFPPRGLSIYIWKIVCPNTQGRVLSF